LVRLVLLFALTLATIPAAAQGRVVPSNYDAFWLWAGVRARPEIETARTVYLLQGEVGPERGDGAIRIKAQGGGGPAAHAAELWLAYRVRSLDWGPDIILAILRRLAAWRGAPGPVAGVEIDFDARTHGLKGYAEFLRHLRAALPTDCKLSVTGLMDWASQGAPEDLDELAGVVDEIVFQTYRGRDTVPDIGAYLARLGRLRLPFKLGLVEGAEWTAPADLEGNPLFRGYVVFLRNTPTAP
jgi:hypothetical protein